MGHKAVKYPAADIASINLQENNKLNDLEMFFLLTQELLQQRIKSGRKGKKWASGDKISYKKAQGVLFELSTYFGLRGAFSFGICANCSHFDNTSTATGCLGTCKGREKHCFDSCNEHSYNTGGFGL